MFQVDEDYDVSKEAAEDPDDDEDDDVESLAFLDDDDDNVWFNFPTYSYWLNMLFD